uniref:Uncharacterized protein n=1 Tax=Nelumbo nucifera TaxID=4432 RepID=A0A822YED4_NELNU|nr:TPA_asm: hypothetical protein HUJ06_029316 [Nelumbo nucifera]
MHKIPTTSRVKTRLLEEITALPPPHSST